MFAMMMFEYYFLWWHMAEASPWEVWLPMSGWHGGLATGLVAGMAIMSLILLSNRGNGK